MPDHAHDHVAVKGRLYHPALAAPQFAFADHEAFAEQDADAFYAYALGVVLMIVDEHVAHVFGMAEYVDVILRYR